MAKCGFRGSRNSRLPFARHDGLRNAQNGSFRQRRTARCGCCRVASEAETRWSLQSGNGLGIRFGDDERQATFMPRNIVAPIRKAGSESCWHSEARRIPYISAHVHNAVDSEQRGRKSGSGVAATCEQPNHARFVRPGGIQERQAQSKLVDRMLRKGKALA